jgi:hypothetical protein
MAAVRQSIIVFAVCGLVKRVTGAATLAPSVNENSVVAPAAKVAGSSNASSRI